LVILGIPFIVKGEGSSVHTRWRTEIENPPRQAKPAISLNLSPAGREGNGEQKAQSILTNEGQKKKRFNLKGHNTVKIKK
jgi:hypothetical protein